MKVHNQASLQSTFLPRKALFIMSVLTIAFFILPSAVIGGEIILQPNNESSEIGTDFEVTATVIDGSAVPDAPVIFQVTGANFARATVTTGDDGTAIFTYTGQHAGTDTIQALAMLPYGGRVFTPPLPEPQFQHEWVIEASQDIAMEITSESICIDLYREKRVPCVDLDSQLAAIEGNDREGYKKVGKAFRKWRRHSTRMLKLLVSVPEGLEAAEVDMGSFELCDPDSEVCVACKRGFVKDADRDGVDDLILLSWIPEMVRDKVVIENSTQLLLLGKTVDERNITAEVPVHMVTYNTIGKWTERWKKRWRKHRHSRDKWKYRAYKKRYYHDD